MSLSKHLFFPYNTALLNGRFLLALLLLVSSFGLAGNAYGHNVQISGREPIRIDDERFSDQTVRTDEIITIIGSISNVSDRPYELSPGIFVTRGAARFDIWQQSRLVL